MESSMENDKDSLENDAKDYNKPRKGQKKRWSKKYKQSIDCNNPKGFSQKQYCKRKERGGSYKESRVEELSRIHKISQMPFLEKTANNKNIRIFPKNISPSELIWHRDEEDRQINIISSNKWYFQEENKLPIKLNSGDSIFIKKHSWHRIIKGKDDLIIEILKNK